MHRKPWPCKLLTPTKAMNRRARELEAVSEVDLVDRLIDLAGEARRWAERGDLESVAKIRDDLRELTEREDCVGARLQVVEVALGYLDVIARSELSAAELTVRRFVAADSELAALVLEELGRSGCLRASWIRDLPQPSRTLIGELERRGLFTRDRNDDRVPVPAALHHLREYGEPAVFRAWRMVTHARELARCQKLDEPETAALFESQLGVTRGQTSLHLRRFPLAGDGSPLMSRTLWTRGSVPRVYRAAAPQENERRERFPHVSRPTGERVATWADDQISEDSPAAPDVLSPTVN